MATLKEIQTTCSYCGTGCQLLFTVDQTANKIVDVHPVKGRTNEGKACLKGWYGWDYLNDPQIFTKRLREPMIRKNGKNSPLEAVSWDEAIAFVADNLKKVKEKWGPDAIMGTGSARGPNEPNYLMQKFIRACIGTNNIDHCARTCHAASVAGCRQTIGEGAMSLSIPEIEDAKVIFTIGYNAATSHPIVARRIIRAKEKGCFVICADPRVTETARIADIHLQLKGGTNIALTNTIANVIITEGLEDKEFIKAHTKDFDAFWAIVKDYTPEYSAPITKLSPDDVRKAARAYAGSKHSVLLWGMGVTQFSQGVEVVKSMCSLAMLTGNFGRPSTGTGPVRGQNNVQGACDMGVLPDVYPGYQNVVDPEARKKFEKAWKAPHLSEQVGLYFTRVPERVVHEKDPVKWIHAYYIMGEDPAQSDPDLEEIRETLKEIDFVVVQDIFMNKTALYADAILPATAWGEHDGVYTCSDRGFQRIRKVVEPVGNIKDDWEIVCLVSTAMGYPMKYKNTEEIWNEMIDLAPKFTGATYEKIERQGSVQWPCYKKEANDTGTMFLHKNGHFATPDGLGILKTSPYQEPKEVENDMYPLTLCTVREVGHYSARSMTGNCRTLRNLEDEPGWVEMSLEDAAHLNLTKGEIVKVSSKRGTCLTRCLPTERVKTGAVYMTYQWWIGACNELTISYLDPTSRTPEYKYCACKIEKLPDQKAAEQEVTRQYETIKTQMGITKEGALA